MAVLVGDNGKVFLGNYEVADITAWRFETSIAGFSFATSATKGRTRRLCGARSGRGVIHFRIDDSAPAWKSLIEGRQARLTLKVNNEKFYEVFAVLVSVSIEVDTSGGKPVTGSATFVTDRTWTVPN